MRYELSLYVRQDDHKYELVVNGLHGNRTRLDACLLPYVSPEDSRLGAPYLYQPKEKSRQ